MLEVRADLRRVGGVVIDWGAISPRHKPFWDEMNNPANQEKTVFSKFGSLTPEQRVRVDERACEEKRLAEWDTSPLPMRIAAVKFRKHLRDCGVQYLTRNQFQKDIGPADDLQECLRFAVSQNLIQRIGDDWELFALTPSEAAFPRGPGGGKTEATKEHHIRRWIVDEPGDAAFWDKFLGTGHPEPMTEGESAKWFAGFLAGGITLSVLWLVILVLANYWLRS